MTHRITLAALLLSCAALGAQTPQMYTARLSPVPIDVAMQATIAGSGRVTATLAGSKLSITGTFDGLKTPATIARIHVAMKGMRGPAILDLQAEPAARGSISGSFDLTPSQIEDLRQSRFYIQLHSEKAPEGNLWGWLLPQEHKR